MTTLLIATRNGHKVQEIRQILGEKFSYLTLNNFPAAPIVAESAPTFDTNAMKKAFTLAWWLSENSQLIRAKIVGGKSRFYVLADDSGLEVDALNGAPGVYSARFAAMDVGGAIGNSPDSANNAKLLRVMESFPEKKRGARFRCVLALTRVDYSEKTDEILPPVGQQTELFEGVCEGRIALSPSGRRGFGYDPLFIPTGHQESFAELGDEVKNKLSHRAKALQKLSKYLSAAS